MSAWVEVHVKGNRRAYVQAGAVVGVLMPAGADGDTEPTDGDPLTVILQGGETLPNVFGLSADELLRRCDGARTILRMHSMESLIVRSEPERLAAFQALFAEAMEAKRGRPA